MISSDHCSSTTKQTNMLCGLQRTPAATKTDENMKMALSLFGLSNFKSTVNKRGKRGLFKGQMRVQSINGVHQRKPGALF